MTKAKPQKTRCHIGRFFKTEKSLLEYMEAKRKEFEKVGVIQTHDYFENFAVIVAKNGLLLISNPNKK